MNLNEEKMVRNYIRGLVKEALYNMGYDIPEGKDGDKKSKKNDDKKPSGHKKASSQKRAAVINALDTEKSDKEGGIKLDVAPYAYALWPDKDEDSARSYFYKCLKGETNDSGVKYSFSDAEINRLYSLLSNNSL